MKLAVAIVLASTVTGASIGSSQVVAAPNTLNVHPAPYEQRTGVEIRKQGAACLEQARQRPDGLVSITLEQYANHLTMLAARTKSGGAELHRYQNDFFFVVEGEATEVVGGTMESPTEISPGEVRGTRVIGGTEHLMRTGDVIHILPNTPHQAVLPPGGHVVYYVIKVTEPDGK